MGEVALVSGFWGQNIGNAFFNLGGRAVLEAAGADVRIVQDQPAYWTFRDEAKGNFRNSWAAIDHLDVDTVVMQGPLFTRNFGNIWINSLRALADRGVGYGLLACAFRSFSSQEESVVREVFERFPPSFVSTRDPHTAEVLRPLYPRVRAGICSAFFLPHAYTPARFVTESPFVNMCFDHFLEPELKKTSAGSIEIGEQRFSPAHPARLNKLAARSKGHAYLAQFMDRRSLPRTLGGLQVVRPEHRTNPHLPMKIYRRPDSIASDEPWTYLSLYAGGELTISDRVHACVAALAYGRPAFLYNPTTRRSALFESVGAELVTSGTVSIEGSLLDEHYASTVRFLSENV